MEYVHKLETIIASWYKGMPHLPANGQKWLAENAWWITLVGVILGAIGVFGLVMTTLVAGAVLVGFGGVVGAAIGGVALVAVLVAVAFSVLNVVLGALAVTPLKALLKKGWTLLFVIVLLDALSLVVSFLFSFNVFSLVWGALFAAVMAYFLFEIRSFYGAESHVRKVASKPAAAKAK